MADSVGRKLAEARWRKGWSRRELVEAASNRITETAIRNIEKGWSQPLPQTIYILAEALDVDPKDYLSDEVAS